jgi:hypothetical protein
MKRRSFIKGFLAGCAGAPMMAQETAAAPPEPKPPAGGISASERQAGQTTIVFDEVLMGELIYFTTPRPRDLIDILGAETEQEVIDKMMEGESEESGLWTFGIELAADILIDKQRDLEEKFLAGQWGQLQVIVNEETKLEASAFIAALSNGPVTEALEAGQAEITFQISGPVQYLTSE